MKSLSSIPSLSDLRLTQDVIKSMIHRTPVLTNQFINGLIGGSVYFKCENFQKIGAFKMRGAASASLRLPEDLKTGDSYAFFGKSCSGSSKSCPIFRYSCVYRYAQ